MNDLIVRSHARSFLQQPLLAFLPLLISLKPILLLLFYLKKTFIAVQWRLRTGVFLFFSLLGILKEKICSFIFTVIYGGLKAQNEASSGQAIQKELDELKL